MAVEDVNNDMKVLPNHKLVMSINDGQCEADVVMKRFIDIIKTKETSRFRSTVGILGDILLLFFVMATYRNYLAYYLTLCT